MIRTGKIAVDLLSSLVAIGVVSVAAGRIGHHAESNVTVAPAGLSAREQETLDKAAGASLFGQFRSSMADFLWLKVDKYLHSGVEIRGLTDQEKKSNTVEQVHTAASDVAKGFKQHQDETTVIPSAAQDWRGELGNIERDVQPYADMGHHVHRNPKEALPLFRLMTATNPNFIPGYVTGAAMIAMDHTKIDEALKFLKEGEANNPQSIEIKTELGYFYISKKHELDTAIPYLQQSIAFAAQRDPKTMSDDELDAREDAYRWLVLDYRYLGDVPRAHAAAIAGLKLFPMDVTCRRQLEIEKNGEWRKYVHAEGDVGMQN